METQAQATPSGRTMAEVLQRRPEDWTEDDLEVCIAGLRASRQKFKQQLETSARTGAKIRTTRPALAKPGALLNVEVDL